MTIDTRLFVELPPDSHESDQARAEESASASEEMYSQAEQMKGIVEELAGLVGGSRKDGNSAHLPYNSRHGGSDSGVGNGIRKAIAVSTRKGKAEDMDEMEPKRTAADSDFRHF